MEKPTHASLFDLDHTLFKGNSSYQFALYLYRKKIFSLFDLSSVLIYKLLFSIKLLTINQLHNLVFERFFKGKEARLIEQLAKEFVEDYFCGLIYEPAVQMLTKAKKNGHYTVILSSSPSFIVNPVASLFEVNEWASSVYSIDQKGEYCAVDEIVMGKSKAEFVTQLIQKSHITRENMTAYSDSLDDLPFLEAVGVPVGVNPDRALHKICKKNCWKMI